MPNCPNRAQIVSNFGCFDTSRTQQKMAAEGPTYIFPLVREGKSNVAVKFRCCIAPGEVAAQAAFSALTEFARKHGKEWGFQVC